MAIVLINQAPDSQKLKQLTQEFASYIKLVADLEKNILYGGSRLHADMEKQLLQQGSAQQHIWGGGVNLITKTIDCSAVANIRPTNPGMEILDPQNRQNFVKIVKTYFPQFTYG